MLITEISLLCYFYQSLAFPFLKTKVSAGKGKSYSTAVLKMPDISGKDFILLKLSSKWCDSQ